jgi:hypothetical protein
LRRKDLVMNARKLFALLFVSSLLVGCDSNPSGPAAPSNAATVEGSATTTAPTPAVKGKGGRLKQAAGATPVMPD